MITQVIALIAGALGMTLGALVIPVAHKYPLNEVEDDAIIEIDSSKENSRSSKFFNNKYYPIVFELVLGLVTYISALKILSFERNLISSILAIVAITIYIFSAAVLTVIDIETKKLPTTIIAKTFVIVSVLLITSIIFSKDFSLLLGMLFGIISLVLMYGLLYVFLSGSLGFGDVRLIGLSGLILGWVSFNHAIVGGVLPWIMGSILVIPLLLLRIIKANSKVPFGPWIILGSLISLLYGDIIIEAFDVFGGI